MERNDIIFNDFVTVRSTDGSWFKESMVLDSWYDGPKDQSEEDKKFWDRQRKCAETVLKAFKDGSLRKAGFCPKAPRTGGGIGYIEFAVRAKDLPDDVWKVLEENGQKNPCVYSGCLPAANMMMTTYRSTGGEYGCVGKSWETNLVISLKTDTCNSIATVRQTFGAYAAALAVLKVYGVPGVEDEIEKIEGLKELIEKEGI